MVAGRIALSGIVWLVGCLDGRFVACGEVVECLHQ